MKKILIPILMGIMILGLLGGCSCSKDDDSKKTGLSNNSTNSSSSSNKPASVEIIESSEYTYNTEDDKNKGKITSFDEVSIDGKILKLDSTFNDVIKDFPLYTTVGKYDIEQEIDVNTSINGNFSCNYKPTTGAGNVTFTFTGNTTLQESKLSSISVFSGATTEQLMTFALPKDIIFGSTLDDIKKAYGSNFQSKGNINSTTFAIEYANLDNKRVQLSGYSSGLAMVTILNN